MHCTTKHTRHHITQEHANTVTQTTGTQTTSTTETTNKHRYTNTGTQEKTKHKKKRKKEKKLESNATAVECTNHSHAHHWHNALHHIDLRNALVHPKPKTPTPHSHKITYLKISILDLRNVLEYPLMLEVVVFVAPLYVVGALLFMLDM
jgi:hypothetical protein